MIFSMPPFWSQNKELEVSEEKHFFHKLEEMLWQVKLQIIMVSMRMDQPWTSEEKDLSKQRKSTLKWNNNLMKFHWIKKKLKFLNGLNKSSDLRANKQSSQDFSATLTNLMTETRWTRLCNLSNLNLWLMELKKSLRIHQSRKSLN